MDVNTGVALIAAAAVIGLGATILIVARQRHEVEDAARESPYAASSEGEKRCPKCGMGNLWTDDTCISCGTPLRESHPPPTG